MSRCTILIYISLLSSLGFVCLADETNGPFTSPTTYSSSSILSPDRYDDNDSFGVADFQVSKSQDSYRVIMRMEHYRNQSSKECSFNVTTSRPISKVAGISFRRSTYTNKFILAWYDETHDSESKIIHRPQIIGIKLDDCRSYDLELPGLVNDPIVLAPTNDHFHVYLDDPKNCAYTHKTSTERCKIFYYGDFVKSNYPSSFDVDLVWSTVKINYGSGETWFYGFDNLGTFRVRQKGDLNRSKEVLTVQNANPKITVVTSDNAYCWVANSNVNVTVTCTLIKGPSDGNDWGQTIYTKIVTFEHAVTPLALRVIGNFITGYKIILFTGDTSCTNDKSCWNLKQTRVSEDAITTVERKFNCTGDWKDLVLDGNIQDYGYWYACRHGDRYLYGVNQL